MKCVIRLHGLGGGAPRSMLQHIKVLKESGYNDVVCLISGGDEALLEKYKQEVNSVVFRKSPAELRNENKRISAYQEYKWEYAFIKQENPQLIIVLGEVNGALYSYLGKKLNIPVIIYIAGAELKVNEQVIDLWEQCEAVCFSKENEETIIKHFSREHLHVISNRIAVEQIFDDFGNHYKEVKSVNVLIVSRLDEQKMQSIYSILNVLSECSNQDSRITVRIAGGGSKEEELYVFCKEMTNPYLQISILGHINQLTEEFRWAHIVAGKGRSVIEPIMMNRLGCIIGEDGKICFCSPESFENLYYYNFSGRNLKTGEPLNEMRKMLDRIKNNSIQETDLHDIARIVSIDYSTESLYDKLNPILMNIQKRQNKQKHAFLLWQYWRFIMKKVEGKLKRQ